MPNEQNLSSTAGAEVPASTEKVLSDNSNVQSQASEKSGIVSPEKYEPQIQAKQDNEQAAAKRTYDRDEVSKIAARAAKDATEKLKAEYETRQAIQGQNAPDLDRPLTLGDLSQMALANQVELNTKSLRDAIVEAEKKYPDFVEKTTNLAMNKIVNPHTAHFFNSLGNAGDVIYSIAGNKTAKLDLSRAFTDPSDIASMEIGYEILRDISTQLKLNENAKKQTTAKEPLEHEKPPIAGVDNGKLSVSELRKLSKYRR